MLTKLLGPNDSQFGPVQELRKFSIEIERLLVRAIELKYKFFEVFKAHGTNEIDSIETFLHNLVNLSCQRAAPAEACNLYFSKLIIDAMNRQSKNSQSVSEMINPKLFVRKGGGKDNASNALTAKKVRHELERYSSMTKMEKNKASAQPKNNAHPLNHLHDPAGGPQFTYYDADIQAGEPVRLFHAVALIFNALQPTMRAKTLLAQGSFNLNLMKKYKENLDSLDAGLPTMKVINAMKDSLDDSYAMLAYDLIDKARRLKMKAAASYQIERDRLTTLLSSIASAMTEIENEKEVKSKKEYKASLDDKLRQRMKFDKIPVGLYDISVHESGMYVVVAQQRIKGGEDSKLKADFYVFTPQRYVASMKKWLATLRGKEEVKDASQASNGVIRAYMNVAPTLAFIHKQPKMKN